MPTVVLVENDRELRAMLSGMLAEHGFTVVAALDALEAVASTCALDEAPELMLLDRRIAHGAESELIEWMRSLSSLPDVPIVLFTVHGTPAQDVPALESLTDAFDPQLLLAIVEGICHLPPE
jgi:DNA-binding response OmpR family regulator